MAGKAKGPKMVGLHVQLEAELHRALKMVAAREGKRLADVVREALDLWAKKRWRPDDGLH